MKIENLNSQIAIILGSKSDIDIGLECHKILNNFQVQSDIKILSAHRSPELLENYLTIVKNSNIKVIIAIAGMAAHLAGTIASKTILPVIGVPLNSSSLNGIDALLSTIQMPSGVPVATMSIGKAGAINSAILALQILALNDSLLKFKLENYKIDLSLQIINDNKKLKNYF